MKQPTSATTTQFALLGLVAAEPATAYGLAKRMELTYAYFWPRARSHVYEEIKKLSGQGYVRAAPSRTGRRPSVTFAITSKGRRALSRWLATPSRVFALEMEPLLRLYLARFGDDAALLGALHHARSEANTMLAVARQIVPAYLHGAPPPPADRLRDRVLLIDFLARFALFVRDWSERSLRAVDAWRTIDDESADARAMQTLRILARELAE